MFYTQTPQRILASGDNSPQKYVLHELAVITVLTWISDYAQL